MPHVRIHETGPDLLVKRPTHPDAKAWLQEIAVQQLRPENNDAAPSATTPDSAGAGATILD